jgi:micrococcal nuclease
MRLPSIFAVFLLLCLSTMGEELVESTGLWAVDGDTIVVEIAGKRDELRIMGIDAVERQGCLGKEAVEFAQGLITRTLWLELDPEKGLERRDRNGRLLAHVFLAPVQTPGSSLAVTLVREGFAKLDVRDVKDIWDEDYFDIRYTPWIIRAQILAALERQGWWGECDPLLDADLVIAAIKHWGNDEIVYIVNRGNEVLDLAAGWVLTSHPSQALDFGRYTRELLLPPGWILRVHTGPINSGCKGEFVVDREAGLIDWYWTGRKVWCREGDVAQLIFGETVVYEYRYPER